MKRGIFITFEGGEGAGKTTLIEGIFETLSLAGHRVVKSREPGGTALGEKIRDLLLHFKGPVSSFAELSLFLASRAQHVAEVIRPALEAGKIILCDRFNDSTVAYQGVSRGLGAQEVLKFCRFVCEGIEPHLTLYLDLDPEKGLGRAHQTREKDRIEREDISFHKKIRSAFLEIHEKNPKRFVLLDANLSPNDVLDEAMKRVAPLLK